MQHAPGRICVPILYRDDAVDGHRFGAAKFDAVAVIAPDPAATQPVPVAITSPPSS
jgi:hypothetical protein